MTAKPPGNRYITKMDYARVQGYVVRLNQYQCSSHYQFFKKSTYKTWALCLAAAKTWRNRYWTNQIFHKHKIYRNFLTGDGVCETWKSNKNSDYEYLYWSASWVINGVRGGRCFSVNKYGYDEAERLATALRYKNTRNHKRRCYRKPKKRTG